MKLIMFGFTTAILATSGMAHAQVTAPTGNVEAGTNVFKKCRACHKVGPDAKNGVGPMLNGIVGRAAGANPGYGYSSAMKNSGLVWDEPTLTTYLHAPRALVPHTKMSFPVFRRTRILPTSSPISSSLTPTVNQRQNPDAPGPASNDHHESKGDKT